jgi:uncharacterized protein with PhoU and TrkA domain
MAIRKSNGAMVFNPPAETPVCGGDYLIVMGQQLNLRALVRALESLIAEPRSFGQESEPPWSKSNGAG